MKRVTYRGQDGRTSAAITIDGKRLPQGEEVEVSDEIAGRLDAIGDGHKFEVKSSSSGSKSTGAEKSSGGASKVSNR